MSSAYKHLFGPVPSRRFGRSLGIDLVPLKTCSIDCIYCQVGKTTNKTIERLEYVPTQDVLAEIQDWLQRDGNADVMTLSGSGEPTLHSGAGEIIRYVRSHTSLPMVVLTNGTLLYRQDVRDDLHEASIVKATMSSWDQVSFEKMHRPHPDLTFERLIEGEQHFRQEFNGQLWLEVFVVDGLNDDNDSICKIRDVIEKINPDKIHINTSVRPPSDASVKAVSNERLKEIANLLGPEAEVTASFRKAGSAAQSVTQEQLLDMLKRRPCTAEQIADVFNIHINEVAKLLGGLDRQNFLSRTEQSGQTYYSAGG